MPRKYEKHGMTGTKVYIVWRFMKRRCYNKKAADYIYYGGRGITVCEDWRKSLKAFYADMEDRRCMCGNRRVTFVVNDDGYVYAEAY